MTLVQVRSNFFLQLINSSLYTIDVINGVAFENYVCEVDLPQDLLIDYYNNLESSIR